MLLFMVKTTRAINDNTASVIYNYSENIETHFWIGLAICVFSLICALILTKIHSYVIEQKIPNLTAKI